MYTQTLYDYEATLKTFRCMFVCTHACTHLFAIANTKEHLAMMSICKHKEVKKWIYK